MEESSSFDSVELSELAPELAEALNEESQPFVGRWNQLVSNTNWEKGRIIFEWREALIAADAPAAEHSDEAWARRVGGVTGQHVGRLRRVYHRFGEKHDQFENLYWSHFQAALDWDDAEMWLEGAVQSRWSVSQMRQQRFETVGGPKPQEGEVVATELDEDFAPLSTEETPANIKGEFEGSSGPRHEGPDFGDADDMPPDDDNAMMSGADGADGAGEGSPVSVLAPVRPFEDLPELPDDLADAFDHFKLAIIAHKNDQWQQISLEDVLHTLDALKALATAPLDDELTA
ncbi:MAG: hypothetical protein KDB14_02185 [Planctomycetales bacterium]|nr:hypothetical protein [Planctomycetales bacterium]